jgi:molecular chaperone HscB
VAAERATRLQHVEQLLDDRGDAPAAAREVRALMFIERFAEDIEARLESLGQ